MAKESSSFESNIGIKWFARIGILAIVLGIAYFIKYAIENNWIDYTARIVLGISLGLLFVLVGEIMGNKEKYLVWARTLTGGGLAIMYFSVYAAYHFVDYRNALGISQTLDIIFLIIIVALGVFLSLKNNSKIIIGESFFLGFVTSFLSQEITMLTLIYTLILSLGLVAVVIYKRWAAIGIVGMIASYMTFFYWWLANQDQFALSMGFLVVYFLVYVLQAMFAESDDKNDYSVVMSVINAFMFTLIGLANIFSNNEELKGLFVLALAVVYFVLFLISRESGNSRLEITNLLLTILYITLAVPIQLQGEWITIIWALEALILTILSVKLENKYLKVASFVIGIITIVKTLLFDTFVLNEFNSNDLLDSTRLFAYLISIICLYFMAWSLRDEKEKSSDVFKAIYYIASTVLLFIIILLEANEGWVSVLWAIIIVILTAFSVYFRDGSQLKRSYVFAILLLAKVVLYDFWALNEFNSSDILASTRVLSTIMVVVCLYLNAGIVRLYKDRKGSNINLNNLYTWSSAAILVILFGLEIRGYWISITWAILAFLILVAGFLVNAKNMRIQGIFILMLTILKVFLYDTRELDTIYKTLSYIVLGVILLVVSFAYSKYKDSIKEIIN